MADTKISALTDGTTADATDKIPVERGGANRYVTPAYVKTYLGVNGTSGKTLAWSNTLTLAGTDSTTFTFPPATANVGYLGSPVNSQSADYTAVIGDAGKTIYHPTTDANNRTFTIPANASVAYEIGTVLTFINDANTVTIAITTDTMVLAGAGTTGSRTLAAQGIASAVKVTATRWIISGTGLT